MPDPYPVKPDSEFLHCILDEGGENLKKCFQCATCSVACELSGERKPFPRKEMIWAQWGLKDRLAADPDVWLCHQCNDCSEKCPRGARPGDVLATIRRQSVLNYAVPRFLGRWVNQPKYLPLLLFIPVVLLGLASLCKDPVENALGISKHTGEKIVYSSTSMFPHWLLNSFFILLSILVFLAIIAGVIRFWRAMKAADARNGNAEPAKGLVASIVSALKNIITHDNFTMCTTERPRFLSHLGVFYGFIALFVVMIWVVTARYNPLIQSDFVYPFNFLNPWRILANVGGLALIAGCLLMIQARWKNREHAGASTFFDWVFIGILLVVAVTGLITELLHYARLVPYRQIAYFIHLVFVFALLMYLPYSKFAHLIYRTTAMVYAEYSGRIRDRAAPSGVNHKKVIAVTISILIVLFPLGYSVVGAAFSPDDQSPQPFLEKPDEQYKECVRDAGYMRIHHMDLIRDARDAVVRDGKKADIELDSCQECHTSRERFCNRCHNAVNLYLDCFICHHYPK
ncbi:MAG: quinone-interacting membrane-bound oxidoreductase complex subunit QmoC [Planctomycetota bacterium]|jgi:quinone-modifying oxidoreductase subunit QmoC